MALAYASVCQERLTELGKDSQIGREELTLICPRREGGRLSIKSTRALEPSSPWAQNWSRGPRLHSRRAQRAKRGHFDTATAREHPDMMSASEGEGGNGKADVVSDVA